MKVTGLHGSNEQHMKLQLSLLRCEFLSVLWASLQTLPKIIYSSRIQIRKPLLLSSEREIGEMAFWLYDSKTRPSPQRVGMFELHILSVNTVRDPAEWGHTRAIVCWLIRSAHCCTIVTNTKRPRWDTHTSDRSDQSWSWWRHIQFRYSISLFPWIFLRGMCGLIHREE